MAKSTSSTSSPLTWNHTCSGSDRILFVAVEFAFSTSAPTVTCTATYNGVSMTSINYAADTASFAGAQLFYLINPATGTNQVSVTTSVSGGTYTHSGLSTSYNGAAQTAQPDSSARTQTTTQTTVTQATTVVASNCWLVGIISQGHGNYTSLGAGTTLRERGNLFGTLVDSNGTVGTGSQSLSITYPGSASSCAIVASFRPSTTISYDTGATSRSRLLLLGVS